MAEVPKSTLALAKASLQTMVSKSAAFQAQVGASTADAALAKIFLSAEKAKDDREFAALRPFAVVGTYSDIARIAEFGGTKNYLRPKGTILLFLTDNDRWPDDPADSSINWDNFIGGVIDDLEGMAALDDNLAIVELVLEESHHSQPDRKNSQTPFWSGLISVVWEN